jgi:hypothetical protein
VAAVVAARTAFVFVCSLKPGDSFAANSAHLARFRSFVCGLDAASNANSSSHDRHVASHSFAAQRASNRTVFRLKKGVWDEDADYRANNDKPNCTRYSPKKKRKETERERERERKKVGSANSLADVHC